VRQAKNPRTTKRIGREAKLGRGSVLADRYRIEAQLGRGSFGVVYRALDLKLSLPVAVKLLDTSMGIRYASWEARFSRLVAHPAIARTFDIGEEQSLPFLVMELIDGVTLSDDLSKNGPCSSSQALFLLERVSPALEEASRQELLHGDLKPMNLMERADGSIVLVDFGTAFLLGAADMPVAGTPAYMAPEILSGDPPSIVGEVYALGATLYEMLSGQLPHDAFDIDTLLSLRREPVPPLIEKREEVDQALSALVERMLSSDPEARPQTFLEVTEAAAEISRSIRMTNSLSVYSQVWGNLGALIVHDTEGHPQIHRLLLEHSPPLVLAPKSDGSALSLLGRLGFEMSSPDSLPVIGARSAVVCESWDSALRVVTAAEVHNIVSVGLPPWEELSSSDFVLTVLITDRERGWSSLRVPSPCCRPAHVTLEDIELVSAGLTDPSARVPISTPRGGPYTEKSASRYAPPRRAVHVLLKTLLQTSVLLFYGSSASGRTSLLLAGLNPVLKLIGWEPIYLPRLQPIDRLMAILETPIQPTTAGRVIIVDDHRQWPQQPSWPWDDTDCLQLLRRTLETPAHTKLLVVTDHDHLEAAAAGLATVFPDRFDTLQVSDFSKEHMTDTLRMAGASQEIAEHVATELAGLGWLPYELQLALKWLEHHAEAGTPTDRFSLKGLRGEQIRSAVGKIPLKEQESARRVLSALVTGRGTALVEELLPEFHSDARAVSLIRKLATLHLVEAIWVGGKPGLRVPVPTMGISLLEHLGREHIELRALRQFLNLEMALSNEFGTKLSDSRLSLLRPLVDSGMLTSQESEYLRLAGKALEEEEDKAEKVVIECFKAEDELSATMEALQRLPADLELPSERESERMWELLRELDTKRSLRRQRWEDAILACHSLLTKDPANQRIRDLLADLHWRALDRAERSAEWAEARHHRDLVALYGSDHHSSRLRRGCSILVDSQPPSVVQMQQIEVTQPTYQTTNEILEGKTPFSAEGLEGGPWLITLTTHGYAPASLALNLRSESEQRATVTLFKSSLVGEEFIHIPAGPFGFGGDPRAPGSTFRREIVLPNFFIARLPVTFRQFCEFLDESTEENVNVEPLVPRDDDGTPLVLRTSEGSHVPIPSRLHLTRKIKYRGNFEMELPVVGITWEAALRFCQWLGDREQRNYRLPTEHEWEKAARGNQARPYPWGESFQPSFCKMRDSRHGLPGMEPVGVFKTDISPFGVRDMAGGVSEWCSDLEAGLPNLRVVRGGSWISGPDQCRSAARQAVHERSHLDWVGFRICFNYDS
jgi:serine/threonine protein kinase/formylglycine-generating enzyme required for sulfatase activity